MKLMTTHAKTLNVVEVTRKKMPRGPGSSTVQKRAEKILDALDCRGCELSIVICDDSFIHSLNKEYRNKDKATDVLSFPMSETPGKEMCNAVLGDIIISVDTARRQAAQRKHPLLDEVTTLLVHGILHLVGYTHENDDDEAVMNAQSERLLRLF
ncbi:MAG: rRNA maturation RNase YbeY [Deltaproteobacteria bacterium]|nr:rRNA maturation RNase YbeY [Deltaproteobacteria bacterium]MBN2670349.1 rRNA maturation RNase YbeY [Deltaproteobacteria bacterium]